MYHAFISYSHAADSKLAPALQLALENFAKPWFKIRNLNVFRDEASMSASPNLWENIRKALENSKYLIYMASPESAKSTWVIRELEYWLKEKSIDTLIIVLTTGNIEWDNEKKIFKNPDEDSLPDILENAFTAEPFFIDIRAAKTKNDIAKNNPIFKREVLKLAAHLHGKEPKDLAGEEVAVYRRNKWLRNSAIIILTLLTLYSFIKTNEAKNNALMAERNAKENHRLDSIASSLKIMSIENKRKSELIQEMLNDSNELKREYIAVLKTELIKYKKVEGRINYGSVKLDTTSIKVIYEDEEVTYPLKKNTEVLDTNKTIKTTLEGMINRYNPFKNRNK